MKAKKKNRTRSNYILKKAVEKRQTIFKHFDLQACYDRIIYIFGGRKRRMIFMRRKILSAKTINTKLQHILPKEVVGLGKTPGH